jgi:hypothetical protein
VRQALGVSRSGDIGSFRRRGVVVPGISITPPGAALLPGLPIKLFGIKQSDRVLEEVAK